MASSAGDEGEAGTSESNVEGDSSERDEVGEEEAVAGRGDGVSSSSELLSRVSSSAKHC